MKPQERDFAMVFESYALYPHLTVAENMAFPLKAREKADPLLSRRDRRIGSGYGQDA